MKKIILPPLIFVLIISVLTSAIKVNSSSTGKYSVYTTAEVYTKTEAEARYALKTDVTKLNNRCDSFSRLCKQLISITGDLQLENAKLKNRCDSFSANWKTKYDVYFKGKGWKVDTVTMTIQLDSALQKLVK